MRLSVARLLRALGMLLFGLALLPSAECTNGIILIDFHGKGSYLPGERPALVCDHSNVSDAENENVVFFRNGKQLQDEDDYLIPPCTSSLSCPTTTLLFHKFADRLSGNYTCNVTSGSQVIASNTLPVASAHYSVEITEDSALQLGGEIQLSCLLNSERTDVEYWWILPDGLSNVYGRLLNLTNVTSNDNGSYTCEITTNLNGNVKADVLVKVVDKAPLFNDVEEIVMVKRDMTAVLDCSAESVGPTSYLWYQNENLITNTSKITISPSGNVLTIAQSQYSDAGIYICRATNVFDSSYKTLNLTVVGAPVFSVSGSEVQLLEGASIILPCNQMAVPEAVIIWRRRLLLSPSELQTIPLTGKFSVGPVDELVISEVDFDDSGDYTCTAYNQYGNETIQYLLRVTGKPKSPEGLSIDEPSSDSVRITWSAYVSLDRRSADILVVELSDDGGSTYREHMTIDTIDATEALVVGLIPNTAYKLRLVAVNQAGTSPPSNEVGFQTAFGVPRLGSVVLTPIEGGRSLLIEWTVEYTGGSPITELFAVVTSQDGRVQRIDLDIESTSQEIGGLEPLTGYTVSLQVANELGPAMENLPEQSVITTRGPPGAPDKPVILGSGSSSATVQVTVTSPGSEPITYFLVDVTENTVYSRQLNMSVDGDNVELDTTSGASSGVFELVVTDLSTTYIYSFSVAAGGQLGHGEFSVYSDDVEVGTEELLYSVIGAVVASAVIIVAIIVSVTICVACARRRSKLRQITISATHSPSVILLPNSPLTKQHMYDDIGTCAIDGHSHSHADHTFSTIPHHKRTHSASSTTSSHMSGAPVKTHVSTCMNGGHSVVTKNQNHVVAVNPYAGSVPDKPGMFRPSYAQKGWFSSPIINRMSYDVDALAPKLSYATDV